MQVELQDFSRGRKTYQNGKWFPLPEAIEQVIHPEGNETLKKAEQILYGDP